MKLEIFFASKSLLLISIPTAKLVLIFVSIILINNEVGILSIASNPKSSNIFKAEVLPAPESPVTIKIF